jgi:hypothetical protein
MHDIPSLTRRRTRGALLSFAAVAAGFVVACALVALGAERAGALELPPAPVEDVTQPVERATEPVEQAATRDRDAEPVTRVSEPVERVTEPVEATRELHEIADDATELTHHPSGALQDGRAARAARRPVTAVTDELPVIGGVLRDERDAVAPVLPALLDTTVPAFDAPVDELKVPEVEALVASPLPEVPVVRTVGTVARPVPDAALVPGVAVVDEVVAPVVDEFVAPVVRSVPDVVLVPAVPVVDEVVDDLPVVPDLSLGPEIVPDVPPVPEFLPELPLPPDTARLPEITGRHLTSFLPDLSAARRPTPTTRRVPASVAAHAVHAVHAGWPTVHALHTDAAGAPSNAPRPVRGASLPAPRGVTTSGSSPNGSRSLDHGSNLAIVAAAAALALLARRHVAAGPLLPRPQLAALLLEHPG